MKPQNTRAKPAFISHSPETGGDYTIYIDAPRGGSVARHAVLLMDGDFLFDPALEAASSLQAEGAIPPLVLVGVGYGAWFGKPGNHRGRDYTPSASPDEPSSGGADRFLAYLEQTLWPELARRHPLREDRRILAGHSLGSLLALYALFQPRPFFNAALASAPSLWWDNRSLLGHVRSLRGRQEFLEGRLYLGVGDDDTPSMTGDLALLEQQLAGNPFRGLEVCARRFPGRDHYNVVAESVRAGLASLLA